jgi:transmembrane sensor
MEPNSPLARYVVTDTSSARVARIWEGVSGRLSQPRPRRSVWLVRAAAIGAVAACAGVGWHLIATPGGSTSAWQNAALSSAGDGLALDLEDGSHIELAAHSRVEVAERTALAVELRLNQGRVVCDVVPNAERRFVVSSAGVEVRVTGTRFSVEVTPARDRVSVEVQRGAVEVKGPNDATPRRLSAGERLTVAVGHVAPEPVASPVESNEPTAVKPVPAAPARSATSNRVPEAHAPEADEDPVPSLEASNARELLDQANSARRAGDVAHAVAGYELLLAKYPSDGRAALAAFELGRLRMDRLGNLPGAVNALRQAMALSKDAGFREDAMARLVRAYDGMGASERCREAQAAYLKNYPSGVHTASVAARCAGRARAGEPR